MGILNKRYQEFCKMSEVMLISAMISATAITYSINSVSQQELADDVIL